MAKKVSARTQADPKVNPKAVDSDPKAGGARPGTEDNAGEDKGKAWYPGLKVDPNDKNRATVRLETVPDDYDPKVHKGLRRQDFKNEDVWFDMRADAYEAKAKEFRQLAEEFRTLGSAEQRAKAKRLRSMVKKMAELTAQLEAQGLDVSAILGEDGDEDEDNED